LTRWLRAAWGLQSWHPSKSLCLFPFCLRKLALSPFTMVITRRQEKKTCLKHSLLLRSRDVPKIQFWATAIHLGFKAQMAVIDCVAAIVRYPAARHYWPKHNFVRSKAIIQNMVSVTTFPIWVSRPGCPRSNIGVPRSLDAPRTTSGPS
jgi:hypothetical protein